MCFDKTGTLTEEGLDMYGVRGVKYTNGSSVTFLKLQEDASELGRAVVAVSPTIKTV